MRVKGVGPIAEGGVMAVGEGPGKKESETGTPFVEWAPAGAEFSRFFNGLALPHRSEIYVTNLFKEWASGAPTKGKEPTQKDLEISEWELHVELQAIKPRLVIALGRWATEWFLGKVRMEVCHGLLYGCVYCPQCGRRWRHYDYSADTFCPCSVDALEFYVVPVVHPAAGLHNPTLAAHVAYDFAQVATYLKLEKTVLWSRCWRPGEKGVYSDDCPIPHWPTGPIEAALDTEGTVEAPVGWSISQAPGTGHVFWKGKDIPFTGYELEGHHWVLHNYMWDTKVCDSLGMEIPEDQFDDTMLMAYLLGVEPQGLKDLAHRHLGQVKPEFLDVAGEYQEVLGKTGKPLKKKKLVIHPLDTLPKEVSVPYMGGDADDTLAMKKILWPKIQALGLEEIYEVDRRVLPLYSRMEQVGLPVNLQYYEEFSHYLAEELELQTILLQGDWPNLNPGSADQVAAIMYDHLKIPGGKKTPSGKRYTTNDKVMEALKDHHPFVMAITEWREVAKLKHTFVDKLPTYCRQRGGLWRLVFQLLPTRVVSGRLAAKNPNALAFPKHTKLGKRFRGGVQAPPGRRLGSWDLNQIELRVLALDSGSPVLTKAFQVGEDLHERTRFKLFGKKGEWADAQRRAAKEVNFGIPMGITQVGLAEQLRKRGYPFPELNGKHYATLDSRREAEAKVCQEWIAAVIADWGIESYIKAKHAEARRYGYVRSIGGRIRFLPSVLSPNKQIREGAQRDAQAYPLQAGARYYMKQIEYRVWHEVIKSLNAEGPSKVKGYPWRRVEPCLDIHDDLLLEFDEDLGEMLKVVIESVVASSFEVSVPITCKGSIGTTWADL